MALGEVCDEMICRNLSLVGYPPCHKDLVFVLTDGMKQQGLVVVSCRSHKTKKVSYLHCAEMVAVNLAMLRWLVSQHRQDQGDLKWKEVSILCPPWGAMAEVAGAECKCLVLPVDSRIDPASK